MKKLLEMLAQHMPAGDAPPQSLRDRLLATAALPGRRYAPFFGALAELFDLDDAALAELFERAATPEAWAASPIEGATLLHLEGGARVQNADNGLVRLRAGSRFPRHRHLGSERIVVLEGGYRDETSGEVFTAGDRHEMAEHSAHAYVALSERDLILAVSVVGGVEVDGLGRLTSKP